jgi:succinate dehydrogenase / fumarate reductase cytochrome b subunit
VSTEALTSTLSPVPPAVAGRRAIASRLGSFIGLVPIGIWTVSHLWDNLAAFDGAVAWQGAVTHHQNRTGELLGLGVLLAFILWHTLWGIRRLFIAQPNAAPYLGNWRYILQRLSALGVLGFLAAHVWLAKLHPLIETGRPETFHDLAWHMAHHLPTTAVYVLGVLGVAFHLGNGLWNFGFSFGLMTSQRGLAWGTRVAVVFALLLLVVGWAVVYAFWRAGGAMP